MIGDYFSLIVPKSQKLARKIINRAKNLEIGTQIQLVCENPEKVHANRICVSKSGKSTRKSNLRVKIRKKYAQIQLAFQNLKKVHANLKYRKNPTSSTGNRIFSIHNQLNFFKGFDLLIS